MAKEIAKKFQEKKKASGVKMYNKST